MFPPVQKLLLTFIFALFLIFLPSSSIHAAKEDTRKFGKTIDDDDVREAIQTACKSKNPLTTYNCHLTLAPYLLQDHYRQLMGPSSCECDEECPMPLALVCATKISSCIDHCKDIHCEECKDCIMRLGDDHDCCPCLSYGVGIVHGKFLGNKLCHFCEPKERHHHHPHQEDCQQPPCHSADEHDECNNGGEGGEKCTLRQKVHRHMHHDDDEEENDDQYKNKRHPSWKHKM